MGKSSRLLIAGREWGGKAGSHLVEWMRRESTISWRDETGRHHGTGREQVGKPAGYIVGKSVGSIVEKLVRIGPKHPWVIELLMYVRNCPVIELISRVYMFLED